MPPLDAGSLMKSLLLTDPLGPELPALFAPAEATDDDASLPPDEPPGIEAPAPRVAPAEVEVSAEFVRKLKLAYGPRSSDPDSRLVGQRVEVKAFLEQLNPGTIRLHRAG
jgi:hypothetical protein